MADTGRILSSALTVGSRTVERPEQLLARHDEVDRIVELLRTDPEPTHVIAIGPQGGGRSSVLRPAAWQVESAGGSAAWWRPTYLDLRSERSALRSLLSAIVESTPDGPSNALLARWRARVWLHDRSPIDALELTSGLVLASEDPELGVDQHVLISDLTTLRQMRPVSAPAIVVLDDAEPVCEDPELTERLLTAFDESGWSWLLAGTAACRRGWRQAHSSALWRVTTVPLRQPRPPEVLDLLTDGEADRELLPSDHRACLALAWEVGRLTSWLPALIVLVGRALAIDARAHGRAMELTAGSLRRVLWLLEDVSRYGAELHTLQRLQPEQIDRALRLVGLHGLSPEQVVTVRELGLVERPPRRLRLDARVEPEPEKVRAVEEEFARLEADGVLERAARGGGWRVVGGSAAMVFFTAAARERSLPRLAVPNVLALTVPAFVNAVVTDALERAGGGAILGRLLSTLEQNTTLGDVLEDVHRDPTVISGLGLRVTSGARSVVDDVLEASDARVGVIAVTLASGADRREQGLVCRLDAEQDETRLTQSMMSALEGAEELAVDLQLRPSGSHVAVFDGSGARLLLAALDPAELAASIIDRYTRGKREAALRLAELAVRAIDRHGVPRLYPRSMRAAVRNQRGFLRLVSHATADAREDFAAADRDAPHWLHRWNAAVSYLLEGQVSEALEELKRVDQRLADQDEMREVFMLAFVAGRLVTFTARSVDGAALRALVNFQRRLIPAGEQEIARLAEADAVEHGPAVAACLSAVRASLRLVGHP